jgi:hypothetical protein
MATSEIHAGICGFKTKVATRMEGPRCAVEIESDCEAIQQLAEKLRDVDPFQEISFRGEGPHTLKLGAEYCIHTACPVPVGIIKAIEIEAGLALPADVTIRLSKQDSR